MSDEYRRRDEDILALSTEEREREALGGAPGYCRVLSPDRTFMCDLPAGHDGDHHGFELPTITLDERI